VVGIVEVCETYQPDPTDETGKFGMVVVKAIQPLPRPVSLEMIKSDPALNNMPLIRQSRLSVMPISKIEWDIILATSMAQG
jgi:predicted RNA-binding protein with PUA-like domain